MDTSQWPQDIVMKTMEEIVVPSTTSSKQPSSLERKIRPQKEQALNCPRCNSTNTKFCYYNNYSLSQPRYFCKTCRRYWTEGGSLRSIPVGGGSRKNKRSSSSTPSSSSSSNSSSKNFPNLVSPPVSQNPKIQDGQDLNLGFATSSQDFKTFSELIHMPNFESGNSINNNNNNKGAETSACSSISSHLSALEMINGLSTNNPIRGLNSFLPMMPITSEIPSSVYTTTSTTTSGFPIMPHDHHFKPSSLSFSLDGLGIGSSTSGYGVGSLHHHVQENNTSHGRLLFPFEDLKQVSNTNAATTSNDEQNRDQNNADSTGYWNGVLGGAGNGGSW